MKLKATDQEQEDSNPMAARASDREDKKEAPEKKGKPDAEDRREKEKVEEQEPTPKAKVIPRRKFSKGGRVSPSAKAQMLARIGLD